MPEQIRASASARRLGLPPGSLVYVGPRSGPVTITLMDFDAQRLEERTLTSIADALAYKDRDSVTWINFDGIHDVALIAEVGKVFDLHPLVLEDITHARQRPKLEDHGNCLYLTFAMIWQRDPGAPIEVEQISAILSRHYVLTFQEDPGDIFDPIRTRIREGKGRVRQMGNDYLMYCLLDTVVDHYLLMLDQLSEEIGQLEDELLDGARREHLVRLHSLKRDLLVLRRLVGPLREVCGALEREDLSPITKTTRLFARDLYDHVIRVQEQLESLRELLASLHDVYVSLIGNRTNEVMKTLALISTIFLPMSFVAGVYGMNFDRGASAWNMPELGWGLGYVFALLVMASVATGLLALFKYKQWL